MAILVVLTTLVTLVALVALATLVILAIFGVQAILTIIISPFLTIFLCLPLIIAGITLAMAILSLAQALLPNPNLQVAVAAAQE